MVLPTYLIVFPIKTDTFQVVTSGLNSTKFWLENVPSFCRALAYPVS